jgi:large conductance mechanosensitive channel
MLKEFRDFIMRGNVLDLAVAVVIGAAFTAIVNSLVGDIIMPIIGVLSGGIDFSGLSITIGSAVITYGKFLQAIVNFLLIGFTMFLVIKSINSLQKRLIKLKDETPPAPVPPEDIVLLREIRDLLKSR